MITLNLLQTKKCYKCQISKDKLDFGKNNFTKDGFRGECKKCCALISKEQYYKKNLSKIKQRQENKQTKKIEKLILFEKICSSCKINKKIEFFNKNKSQKDSHSGYCKLCSNLYKKEWLEKNPNKRENARELNRIYHSKYKDKIKERKRKYKSDPDVKLRIKQKRKEYLKKNSEKIKKWRYEYARLPKSMVRNAERERKKRKNDITYNISSRISRAIRLSTKKEKNLSWKNILNYTALELRKSLESKFTSDMTWDKYISGDIHIDHLIPLKAFYFENYDNISFHLCWSINNLYPKWKNDNKSKNDQLPDGSNARDLKDKITTLSQFNHWYTLAIQKEVFDRNIVDYQI